MNILQINNNVTTNYCNRTKANNTPAFKGQFLDDDRWRLEQVDISTDRRNDIDKFFKKYMSPGVNVATDCLRKLYFSPWYNGWNSIKLLDIPDECCVDKNFYITNAKAIEDDVLTSFINYIKGLKCSEEYKKSEYRYKEFVQNLTKYLNQQKAYFNKYEKEGRFSASYGVKLQILENMVHKII